MYDIDALILDRINTRESSTLTFATVAASSSLVVLVLFIERGLQTAYPWLGWIGILFASLGVLYREVTIWSIDKNEYDLLSCYLRKIIEPERKTIWSQLAILIRRTTVRVSCSCQL